MEHRLKVFENRMLRRIFGLKRNEVTVRWGKLHREKLHKLYSSPSQEDEKCRAWSMNGEKRSSCRLMVGKPEGKRPLGRLT
jgi:hypothetical protein